MEKKEMIHEVVDQAHNFLLDNVLNNPTFDSFAEFCGDGEVFEDADENITDTDLDEIMSIVESIAPEVERINAKLAGKPARQVRYVVLYTSELSGLPYAELGKNFTAFETFDEAFSVAKDYLTEICEGDGTDFEMIANDLYENKFVFSANGSVKVSIEEITI